MFSLIITIVAIALVAALALATIYYGGAAFNKGVATATATRAISQGQQIQGAMDLYRADFGEWPTKEQILGANARGFVYLRSWPEGPAQTAALGDSLAVTQAMAQAAPGGGSSAPAGRAWLVPSSPAQPTAVLSDSVSRDVCAQINQLSRGDNGIANTVSSSYATQCFSPDGARYVVVVTKAGFTELSAGLNDPGAGLRLANSDAIKVTAAALNTGNPADTVWVSPPSVSGNSNGGSAPQIQDSLEVINSVLQIPAHSYSEPVFVTTRQFSVRNTGTAPVEVSYVLGLPYFDVVASTCFQGPLAPEATCDIDVRLVDNLPDGSYSGTIDVVTTKGLLVSAQISAELANGVATGLTPDFVEVDFGDVSPSSPVQTREVVLTNNGTAPVTVREIEYSQTLFTLGGSCMEAAPTPPGASCILVVTFDPGQGGLTAGSLDAVQVLKPTGGQTFVRVRAEL